MNYPKIESFEYLQRVNALRKKMAENGVDLVVGFSNLLEIAIVRYYCGFAPVNESAAIVIPAQGQRRDKEGHAPPAADLLDARAQVRVRGNAARQHEGQGRVFVGVFGYGGTRVF